MRNRNLRAVLGLLALVVIVTPVANESHAQVTHADPSWPYGIGARAVALAGAVVASADDGTAPYWNPAAMNMTSNLSLSGTEHRFTLSENANRYLSLSGSFGKFSLGGSYLRADGPDIQMFGPGGEPTGGTRAVETLFIGAWSVMVKEKAPTFGIGGALQYYHTTLADQSGHAFTGNLGAFLKSELPLHSHWALGATADLLQPSIQWTTNATDVAFRRIQFGGLLAAFNKSVVAVGQVDGQFLRFGLEVNPIGLLGIIDKNLVEIVDVFNLSGRIGWRRAFNGPDIWKTSYGVGLRVFFLDVDVAVMTEPLVGTSVMVTGQIAF